MTNKERQIVLGNDEDELDSQFQLKSNEQETNDDDDDNDDDFEEFEMFGENLVEKLKRMWLNEKFSPELLPYGQKTVSVLLKLIVRKEKQLAHTNSLKEYIYQLEIDRLRYVLGSYLRIRLWKIEKLSQYIMKKKLQSMLSDAERKYLNVYSSLEKDHLSFLKNVPEYLQNDPQYKRTYNAPDMSQFVFCRALQDLGNYKPSSDPSQNQNIIQMSKGQIYIFIYEAIKDLLQNNQVELI